MIEAFMRGLIKGWLRHQGITEYFLGDLVAAAEIVEHSGYYGRIPQTLRALADVLSEDEVEL